MSFTKVGPKFQVTIPKEAREAIGLQVGDVVETTVTKNQIVIRQKLVVDKHPVIEAHLREAEEDIKAGRVSPAFDSVDDLLADLNNTKGESKKKHKKTR